MSSSHPPAGPHGPEYLEQGGGAPVAPTGSAADGRPSRTRLLVGGGAVAALALVGGGVWAAVSFFGQGPQPAEALPATTLGYVSVDLDPSGSQKIEAIRMLRQFPAFEEEVGLETDDDLRRRIFEESGIAEACDGLDYDGDVEPWLGNRFAVAAVDLGEEQPAPVLVAQVSDAEAAEEGMQALVDCAAGEDDLGGWAVEGEWMVVAETDSIADDVVAASAEDSLADDSDYQRWTSEAGDSGVAGLYVAPEAGRYVADAAGSLLGLGGLMTAMSCDPDGDGADACTMPDVDEPGLPDEVRELLEGFEGGAATLRFDDGALELELAGDPLLTQQGLPFSEGGDDVLSTLPDDTAAAFGVGFTEGWLTEWLDQMSAWGIDVDGLVAEAEATTGLDLPEDVETLAGESAALALSADLDADELAGSTTPEGLPMGVKVKGDPEAIEGVLDTLRTSLGDDGQFLLSQAGDDTVAVSPDEGYLDELAADGELGGTETFQDVVREAEDAGAILFVDFDAGDDWLVGLAGDDEEAAENLAPLEGLGVSGWLDDGVGHVVLRLTTD